MIISPACIAAGRRWAPPWPRAMPGQRPSQPLAPVRGVRLDHHARQPGAEVDARLVHGVAQRNAAQPQFLTSAATRWRAVGRAGDSVVVFPAALGVAGDVHLGGGAPRASATARRRCLAFSTRRSSGSSGARCVPRFNGGSAAVGSGSLLLVRPLSSPHPPHPLSWVHGGHARPARHRA